MSRPLASTALALALSAGLAPASQEVHRVRPSLAAPGDELVIEGVDLEHTATLRLTVLRGGALGAGELDLVPTSVTAREVRARMPLAAPFARPGAMPPASPLASLTLSVAVDAAATDELGLGLAPGSARVGELPLFLLEATGGRIAHLGASSGDHPASIGFAFPGGAPHAGNHRFALRLEGAPVGLQPVLLVGSPLAQPLPLGPAGAGSLAVDPDLPLVPVWAGLTTDADGELELSLALPERGVPELALQWAWFDAATGEWCVSEGLAVSL